MQKIRAVFFDLNNTLIDFMQMKEESCKAAIQAMISAGLKMDQKEAFCKLMETYYKLGLESDFAFTQFLKENNKFDHKILAATINKYQETKADYVKPYPNVKSVLQNLKEKGVVLSIVTDAPKTKAYQRLLTMGIDKYFEFVVGFEDTNLKKHTGLTLELAVKLLNKEIPNIKNSEILMVGDSINRDLKPAVKLGLKTAVAKYRQISKEKGTVDYELENINEFIRIV